MPLTGTPPLSGRGATLRAIRLPPGASMRRSAAARLARRRRARRCAWAWRHLPARCSRPARRARCSPSADMAAPLRGPWVDDALPLADARERCSAACASCRPALGVPEPAAHGGAVQRGSARASGGRSPRRQRATTARCSTCSRATLRRSICEPRCGGDNGDLAGALADSLAALDVAPRLRRCPHRGGTGGPRPSRPG